jgi:D-serine deaminase-like pyridoxal phosphate-dependent protein
MPDSKADRPWYLVTNVDEIASPALLVYPERVRENIRRMIVRAGSADRVRPHVKTHKMSELVRMKLEAGLTKFKCSTIAEAEMTALAGATDVMLAYPQVGPNAARLARLVAAFPTVQFSTIVDDRGLIDHLSAEFTAAGQTIEVLLDLDNGMHRSGIAPGPAAHELYARIARSPGLKPGGLHLYDGQVRDRELVARAAGVRTAFESVEAFWKQLLAAGLPVPRVVAGGSASFPVHAERADIECSPGTCVFWDINYSAKFPELEFEYAALVLGRVVSKPGDNRLCLDLGYKAVSPDNPQLRVVLFGLEDAEVLGHYEEHLMLGTPRAAQYAVGDAVYGVPYHICPTVALHREALVVENGRVTGCWAVVARDRKLTY